MPEDQKTDTAAKPRGWTARLRDKWIEALIATVIGIIITALLGYFWGIGITTAKSYYAEWQNISYEDALAEAKENVGAEAIDVIPFRNADSNQQYIAVITDPPKSETPPKNPYPAGSQEGTEFRVGEETKCAGTQPLHQCYPIKILQKTGGTSPEVIDPGLAAYDSAFDNANIDDPTPEQEYRNTLLGVVDIDEDGNKEVYSLFRSLPGAGSGFYMIKIKLYDSLTGESYELRGDGEHTSTTVNPRFTGKRPKEEFSTWMNQQAGTLVLFNQGKKAEDEEWEQLTEVERYDKEVQDWLQNNGTGFDEGQLIIEEHEGQIPSARQLSCFVDDGDVEWNSYFKGALFSYNRSTDTHYVVWVPKDVYAFASNMFAGKRYLWLDVAKDDSLLAFDKEAQALVLMPVPELKGTLTKFPASSDYGPVELLVDDSSLYRKMTRHVQNGVSTTSIIPLTLPDTINVEEEFEGAAGCSNKP